MQGARKKKFLGVALIAVRPVFSAAPWLIKIQQLTEEAMKPILSKLLGRAGDLLEVQPVLALFLAGAFLAVFLTALFVPKSTAEQDARASLLWTLYRQGARLVWAEAGPRSPAGPRPAAWAAAGTPKKSAAPEWHRAR